MNITEYSVEEMFDPTGIIEGQRFELRIYVTVDEDDELYREAGLGVRAIVSLVDGEARVLSSYFFERERDKPMPYSLEDDELEQVTELCQKEFFEQ